MKVKFLLLSLMPIFVFAKVHYAKVEPYETIVVKSSVSALVLDVNLEAEGSMVEDKKVVNLDDRLDKLNLEASKKNKLLLDEMFKINKDIAEGLKSTLERQEGYYKRINKLSTASKTQKDNAYSVYISAKTQYLNTKEKIANLEKQINDIAYKIAQLKDSIEKKSLILQHQYLYKLMVRKGDHVVPGSTLAEVMDADRAKLVLFLDADEIKELKEKIIYLDDKKTEYKVNKVWRVADKKFISSYRAEIYIPAPKDFFSKLVKVEIK